jgi:hypothetical protein
MPKICSLYSLYCLVTYSTSFSIYPYSNMHMYRLIGIFAGFFVYLYLCAIAYLLGVLDDNLRIEATGRVGLEVVLEVVVVVVAAVGLEVVLVEVGLVAAAADFVAVVVGLEVVLEVEIEVVVAAVGLEVVVAVPAADFALVLEVVEVLILLLLPLLPTGDTPPAFGSRGVVAVAAGPATVAVPAAAPAAVPASLAALLAAMNSATPAAVALAVVAAPVPAPAAPPAVVAAVAVAALVAAGLNTRPFLTTTHAVPSLGLRGTWVCVCVCVL